MLLEAVKCGHLGLGRECVLQKQIIESSLPKNWCAVSQKSVGLRRPTMTQPRRVLCFAVFAMQRAGFLCLG